MKDQSTQLSMPDREGASEGGIVLYEIEATDWEAANVEFCKRMGRGSYIPNPMKKSLPVSSLKQG